MIKRFSLFAAALLVGWQCAGQTNVLVQFDSLSYLGGGQSGRTISISPVLLIQNTGTNVVVGGTTTVPGGPVATNLWTGVYNVTIQGIAQTVPMVVTTNFGAVPGGVPWVWFTTNLPSSYSPANPFVVTNDPRTLVLSAPTNYMQSLALGGVIYGNGGGLTNVGASAGVGQILAGSGITVSPTNGQGVVTITAAGSSNYVGTFTGNGNGLTNLNLTAVIASATNAFNISTNFITGDSMRVLDRGIDFYGVNRFNWSNTIGVLATNGPLTLWFWGNGWVRDSLYISALTNMTKSKPLIGYGGFLNFKLGGPTALRYAYYWSSYTYDQNIGVVDFGVTQTFDPQYTNWLFYVTLTNNSIFSPIPSDNMGVSSLTANGNLNANVARVCYLKNPSGNTFYVEVRTNDAAPATTGWTNIDGTWTTVATLSSFNATWTGATYTWTNPLGLAPTQVRVRCGAVSQFTPIVDMGLWNNTITNGILVGMFAQEGGPNLTQWTNSTLSAKTGPIWAAENPNMVIFTGGFDDSTGSPIFNLTNITSILRTGFTNADIIDTTPHNDVYPSLTFNTETAWCYSNGVAFFNGTTATLDAWGSIQNAVNLGLVDSVGSGHLLGQGYVYFGEMIGAWFGFYKQYRQPFATTSYSGTFTGNGGGLTNVVVSGPTNTAPGNTTVIKAWANFTNSSGGVFKLPLYQ